ncbi:MAG: transposase [Pseudomonadota bacterium]
MKLLREIELKLALGDDVASACRSIAISDAPYYNWRKRIGGMVLSQLPEMKSLEKENDAPIIRQRSEDNGERLRA